MDAVEVDLDENEATLQPRRTRAPLVAAGAVLALSLGALLGAGREDSARPEPSPSESEVEDTGPTRLAGETVAPSLDERWQVRWDRPGTVLAVSDAVLVTSADGTGVIGLAADGTAAWGPRAVGATCSPGGRGVVCLPGPTGDGVVRAYSGTGDERTWEPGFTVDSWWVQDGDVVVVGKDDGALVIERWTPPGPRGVSWSYRSEDQVVAPAGYPFSVEHTDTWVRVGGTRSVLVDLGSGEEITSPEDAGAVRRTSEPVLGLYDRSLAGAAVVSDGATVVVGGRLRVPAPAQIVVAGVVVAGLGEMTAWDVGTGTELWAANGSGAFSDGVHVGVVESGDRTDLVAREIAFGDILWTVPLPDCATYAGITAEGVVLDACGEVLLAGPGD